MAKDETASQGLFSKVVKFVRNPGTNWTDLDSKDTDRENAYSKQALKEMIERKRRNDFVRKREFDMLRKLRRREALGAAAGPADGTERPSFFQSSMPSKPDDRAMTLKKIDEIEAQMSMQWWKTKHGPSGLQTSSGFPNSDLGSSTKSVNPSDKTATPNAPSARAYAATEPDNLTNPVAMGNGNAPQAPLAATAPAAKPVTQPTAAPVQRPVPPLVQAPMAAAVTPPKPVIPASHPAPRVPDAPVAATPTNNMNGLATAYTGGSGSTGFSTSKLFALQVDEIQHDPELEEAAIRFANGDDAGAEAGLLEVLSPQGARHNDDETWYTAFDLYRATGKHDRFESLAIDFASKFNRSAPAWFSMPEMVGALTGTDASAPAKTAYKSDWRSPANFGVQTLAALNAALARSQMPWTLDWSVLKTIEPNAVVPLGKLFASWAAQPVQLRFMGAHVLDSVLRDATPSGSRDISQDLWKLRLEHLRITHRPDEFELAALDFCVTYEVSPPSWESARCEYKLLDVDGVSGVGQTIIGEAVRDSVQSELSRYDDDQPTSPVAMQLTQLSAVELAGQIYGDPVAMLEELENRMIGADVMVISCAKLIRVDFSAAGTLLNWVSARQTEGRIVQFTEVNRLVAAFFHVIGISEHAKVVTRIG
jgi:ABC-type transporter Mla MlaB component